jgi:hypothetical protein
MSTTVTTATRPIADLVVGDRIVPVNVGAGAWTITAIHDHADGTRHVELVHPDDSSVTTSRHLTAGTVEVAYDPKAAFYAIRDAAESKLSRQLASFLARHTYEWTRTGARIEATFRNGRRTIIVVSDGSLDFALVYRGDDLLGRHTTLSALRRLAADS